MAFRAVTLITSTSTINTGYDINLIDASSFSIILTLPSINNTDGKYVKFKRIDIISLNTVTISGFIISELIDGILTKTIAVGTSLTLVSYGGVWYSVHL